MLRMILNFMSRFEVANCGVFENEKNETRKRAFALSLIVEAAAAAEARAHEKKKNVQAESHACHAQPTHVFSQLEKS